RDWSSDVCSSDLSDGRRDLLAEVRPARPRTDARARASDDAGAVAGVRPRRVAAVLAQVVAVLAVVPSPAGGSSLNPAAKSKWIHPQETRASAPRLLQLLPVSARPRSRSASCRTASVPV